MRHIRIKNKTFKVEARRAKKQYPMNSMEINCELGGAILDTFPEMKVDVHEPDIRLNVEIREEIYLYSQIIPGPGGMPVGTNGSAMLFAVRRDRQPGCRIYGGKAGVELEATYFHAPPYTSERAKEKVVDLARIVAGYAGPIKLHVVNFTDIQLYIYEQCPHEELDNHHAAVYDEDRRTFCKEGWMSWIGDRGKYRSGGESDNAESGGDKCCVYASGVSAFDRI